MIDSEGQSYSDLDSETAYFSFVLTENGLFRVSIDYYFEILSVKKIYENKVKNLDRLSVSDKLFFLMGFK